MTPPTFDLEQVYDDQIYPLMAQIIAICNEYHMPMVASFCYKNLGEDGETAFCTTHLLGPDRWVCPELKECYGIVRNRNSGLVAFTIKEPQ
jgi:hypothetical protein